MSVRKIIVCIDGGVLNAVYVQGAYCDSYECELIDLDNARGECEPDALEDARERWDNLADDAADPDMNTFCVYAG